MKIRIKGNTIRFRLTRPEVKYFGEHKIIEEKTEFEKNSLSYVLKITGEENEMKATFSDDTITLLIPQGIAEEWVRTEKVGCRGEMDIGNGKKLFLLLEKDFKCLDHVDEDQSDHYENPLALKNK
ncbi:MAG: hypothetical protein NT126_01265 [Bacteroidetes bacterium]|nr:hypothetical protein [Bacteroidota bacterium]